MAEYNFECWCWWRALIKGDRRRGASERLPERVRTAVEAAARAGSWGELLGTRRDGAPEPEMGEARAGRLP